MTGSPPPPPSPSRGGRKPPTRIPPLMMMVAAAAAVPRQYAGGGALALSSSSYPSPPPRDVRRGRRDVLAGAAGAAGSILAGAPAPPSSPSYPAAAAEAPSPPPPPGGTTPPSAAPFAVYGIRPDPSPSLSPSLDPVSPGDFLRALAMTDGDGGAGGGGAIWLGEHHNSASDHGLQAEFVRRIHEERGRVRVRVRGRSSPPPPPMAIGLEQVQARFQPALDEFADGKMSVGELRDRVDWDRRWVWPFEVYEPIFEVARELKIPLVALNVDSEDLGPVEKSGLPGLSRGQLQKYIRDPAGFAEFTKPQAYRTYVDYVIRPSYDMHSDMGLLRTTISGQKLKEDMTFRNFFSGRILWDEAMASAAYDWCASNPGGLMVGLVGADHVKFVDGVPGRFVRMAGRTRSKSVSVLLNPTLIDTRPSGSVPNDARSFSSLFPEDLTLQLRYVKEGTDVTSPDRSLPQNTGGVLPLADYIVVSGPISPAST